MDKMNRILQVAGEAVRGLRRPSPAATTNKSRGSVEMETGCVQAPSSGESRPSGSVGSLLSLLTLSRAEPRSPPPPTFVELLGRLPPELWHEILGYMTLGDMIRLRRTCRALHHSIPNELLSFIMGPDLLGIACRTCRTCLRTRDSSWQLLSPWYPLLFPPHLLLSECIPCKSQRGAIAPDREWFYQGRRMTMCAFCAWPTTSPPYIRRGSHLHPLCVTRYANLRAASCAVALVPLLPAVGLIIFIALTSEVDWTTKGLLAVSRPPPPLPPPHFWELQGQQLMFKVGSADGVRLAGVVVYTAQGPSQGAEAASLPGTAELGGRGALGSGLCQELPCCPCSWQHGVSVGGVSHHRVRENPPFTPFFARNGSVFTASLFDPVANPLLPFHQTGRSSSSISWAAPCSRSNTSTGATRGPSRGGGGASSPRR